MATILRKCAHDGAAGAESGGSGWQPSWGSIGGGVHVWTVWPVRYNSSLDIALIDPFSGPRPFRGGYRGLGVYLSFD